MKDFQITIVFLLKEFRSRVKIVFLTFSDSLLNSRKKLWVEVNVVVLIFFFGKQFCCVFVCCCCYCLISCFSFSKKCNIYLGSSPLKG